MRNVAFALLVAALMPIAAEAQVGGRRGQPPRMQAQQQNRRALERQILRRFAEQSGQEMGLTPVLRGRLAQILDNSNEQRRALAVESAQLRQRLTEALRDTRTTDDQFRDILDDMDDLRSREHELWKRDQEALAGALTPRQRAMFMVRWLRFQDNIRDLIDRRPGGAPDTLSPFARDVVSPGGAGDLFSGRG